jgi:hypothetical protein
MGVRLHIPAIIVLYVFFNHWLGVYQKGDIHLTIVKLSSQEEWREDEAIYTTRGNYVAGGRIAAGTDAGGFTDTVEDSRFPHGTIHKTS